MQLSMRSWVIRGQGRQWWNLRAAKQVELFRLSLCAHGNKVMAPLTEVTVKDNPRYQVLPICSLPHAPSAGRAPSAWRCTPVLSAPSHIHAAPNLVNTWTSGSFGSKALSQASSCASSHKTGRAQPRSNALSESHFLSAKWNPRLPYLPQFWNESVEGNCNVFWNYKT